MASKNRAELIGHIGIDPEVRTTTDGGKVASLTLATSEKWKDERGTKHEKTEWHRIVCWNRGNRALADLVAQYVHKGDQIAVEGRIRYRDWEDRDGVKRSTTEIDADEILFLTTKRQGGDDARA